MTWTNWGLLLLLLLGGALIYNWYSYDEGKTQAASASCTPGQQDQQKGAAAAPKDPKLDSCEDAESRKLFLRLPELKRQHDWMNSKPPWARSWCERGTCGVHRLPNLASYYLGSRLTFQMASSTCPKVTKGTVSCRADPNIILMPMPGPTGVIVGQNYWFLGSKGSFIVTFPSPIFISGVTLIHPLKAEIPYGKFDSAPKDFSVVGLKIDGGTGSRPLGTFTYDPRKQRGQFFPVQSLCLGRERYGGVQLNINSNQGGTYEYTAVYKFEVHGIPGETAYQDKDLSGGCWGLFAAWKWFWGL